MIYPDEIENQTFSTALRSTAAKASFLSTVIRDAKHGEIGIFGNSDDFEAVGCMLREISEDLIVIGNTLYPDEASKSMVGQDEPDRGEV